MSAGLPDGWTIDRVRQASGDSDASVLSLERLVVIESHDNTDYVPLRPDVIISFHGLCLVSADGEWFMGDLDTDGSVICWASYGSDLGQAIQGL
ncbi:MAG TPA: hypothetical protein VF070_11965 [Streptosporangiaceae bacterium]